MIRHYDSIGPNSEYVKKEYEFEPPKYGPSTTDPTFYEPTATRIANMRKSANAGKSLYDFEENKNIDISKVGTMFGRKPGMTLEEVSHVATQNQLRMESQINEYDEAEKSEAEQIKRSSKQAKAIKQALDSNDAGSSDSE